MKKNHIIWHETLVKKEDRNRINNHRSGLVWFTGLSASGKSTIAHALDKALFQKGIRSYVLDGDNIRHGINSNLGFNREDRKENLRRVIEISKLFVDAGIIVLAAFISPYKEDRDYIKSRFKGDNFLEIYIKCSLEECERRDPKEQYKKARAGIIMNYTGIDAPYEEPEKPDLIVKTDMMSVKQAVREIINLLDSKGFFFI